jgi:hypothetical protein
MNNPKPDKTPEALRVRFHFVLLLELAMQLGAAESHHQADEEHGHAAEKQHGVVLMTQRDEQAANDCQRGENRELGAAWNKTVHGMTLVFWTLSSPLEERQSKIRRAARGATDKTFLPAAVPNFQSIA